jgi:hypothetical protein
MKQIIVGNYYCGYESVELVLRDDTGGEYFITPERGHIARIKIGADYVEWQEVVSVLLHEAMELVCDRLKARYQPTCNLSGDHGQYWFLLSHADFSDACGRVAEFISACLPDLAKAWKKIKRAVNK